ncbi:MAG: dTDP-4-dehydrorhamnose 3,5-epimerase [Pseudobacteriovorax sp.]|nr:dTDP-4-dehydrorhamnose 3,5-epimerase [Pseudobacteriovorax sp.]
MEVVETALPEVKLIKPKIFGDDRGFFYESFRKQVYQNHGITLEFVQDNLSKSNKGVLRGLHLQNPNSQGKLVTVLSGEVYDVAVDVRVGSPNFGKSVGFYLSEHNKHQLWVPPGFAHGFQVTSESATFFYKCTDYYNPRSEMSILWNDPKIAIDWPLPDPSLSEKDRTALSLDSVEESRLCRYTENT